MYEGMKMLIAAIFGNRNVIWNVESMNISADNVRWIVTGVKPLVQEMKLFYRFVNLNGLRSICHPTSFPLKKLNIELDPRILNHEIVVNAEKLLLRAEMFIYETDYLHQLMEVLHPRVRFSRVAPIFFSELMDHWLAHGRPVGTSWSFQVGGSASGYINVLRENDEVIESDRRFHLSLHLPPLRYVEKRTHLKINKLIFKDNEITVNQTTYKLSIDRKYEIEKPPFSISGPINYDVDEFGCKTSTKYFMINGDVCMESSSNGIGDGFRRIRLSGKESGLTVTMRKKTECKSTLKLTVTSENGEQRIYASSKITKIYEGMKMLIAAIFGNRTVIWNVESMLISTGNVRWISSGEKPFVREMKLGCYHSVNLDSLRSICHPSSFPLKSLRFEMDNSILDHEILVNAENLIVASQSSTYGVYTDNHLHKISNLKVRLFSITEMSVVGLMDMWLEQGRPVGTSWSFEVDGSAEDEPIGYINTLRSIARSRENAQLIETDDRRQVKSIKLSMSPSSILSVSYGHPICHDHVNRRVTWKVKMEVLQR
ncbi:hypothetical protein B9Z55_000169 [Caenorhabditis nigoni]|uniref:Uncharacterized protein n=1 Tax=Caenorhabditis nigoni TaxID=1611254 RepID=A0A2G5VGW2_9PELO|nr:hypothetical protein B9Z55_000169 [Caenorhabditis nigoni]